MPAATRANQESLFRRVDLSGSRRLPIFFDLIRTLQEADNHRDALDGFVAAMRHAYGARGYVSLSVHNLNAVAGEFRITRWTDESRREHVDHSIDPWTGETAPTQQGGLLGELVRHPEPTLVRDLDLQEDPALGDWIGAYRSMMAVPLMEDGIVTNWALIFDPSPNAFDEISLEDFVLRASLIGQAVTAIRTANRLQSANRWIEQEVDQIAAIQRAMLPERMPDIHGVTMAADYRTYDKAGGDYYTVFPLGGCPDSGTGDPTGKWCVLVADASGHGPAAAVLMAMLHTMVCMLPDSEESRARAYADPAAFLAHLNNEVCEHSLEGSFVTALAAFYDPLTRVLRYASAGHPPAVVKTRGTDDPCIRLAGAGGLPLGIMQGFDYESAKTTLAPGQTAVFYTDGITEAMSPPPPQRAPSAASDVLEGGWAAIQTRGEMFGVRGIENALAHCSGEPPCVIESVFDALRAHEAGQRPGDDQTIVAFGVN